jgi:hypothetical protein
MHPGSELPLAFASLLAGSGFFSCGLCPWWLARIAAAARFDGLHRRLSIQARFKPRFFSLRQFETMIQVADTMIDTDGQNALHPIEVAIRADHFLASFDAKVQQEIKSTLVIVEWLLPLLVLGRPFPFSSLGSHERRRAVEKVIGAKGLFRDVARFLKLLACAGYYGTPEGMAQVGYIPFEERQRAQGVSQAPAHYPDPALTLKIQG